MCSSDLGVGGGGGTSCHPVFEWIGKNCHTRPDALVCFTDGYVDFPDAPPPVEVVIWASTARKPEDYPYGDAVEINTRG